MRRPPVQPKENIFARGVGTYIFRVGIVMAVLTLGFAYWAFMSGNPSWKTMVFTLLIFLQAGHALANRSDI